MKIAVLGGGGREHAIVWKLTQTIPPEDIYALPGNGGIPNSIPIDISQFETVKQFCQTHQIELIIVGPETPLADGIVDYFSGTGMKIFGPAQKAARLESSKIWAKQFMKKYGVATADFQVFENNIEGAKKLIRQWKGDVVIKYDGLAGGKGVFVCASEKDAVHSLHSLLTIYGESSRFVIEKKLIGSELSLIGLTDGKSLKLLTPSQDHKQLFDGDRGPNTGGMGAYCPVAICDDRMMAEIMRTIAIPTLQGIQAERLDYKGVIYFGVMLTPDGPQLLEYNARFGDPETEVILPALRSDLLPLILACLDGTLDTCEMQFNDGCFVDVVLTSGGYPGAYATGYEIAGLDALPEDVLAFHAGTARKDGKIVTAGGRVLNLVAHAPTLLAAIERAYEGCQRISYEKIYYRKDIGRRDL